MITHSFRRRRYRIDLLADPALQQDDVEAVFGYLAGRSSDESIRLGGRSIVIRARAPGPLFDGIKIKGAGLRWWGIKFGRRHRKPYALPRYDFEGAATVDAAKDHGRAFAGGMSYQQACQEYVVSRHLCDRGVKVLPPLGYGAIRRGRHASWFCLLQAPFGRQPDWWELTHERDQVLRVATAFGKSQLELAEHSAFLALSGMTDVAGQLVRKDFHTVHLAGPNDSFLTKLSYFLFDVNFILAEFVIDHYVPDIDDHRDLAKIAYIDALTGRQFEPAEIDRFKSLLVASKFPTWEMDERMQRLRQDEIGKTFLELFLGRSEHRLFFVDVFGSDGKTRPEDVLHPTRRERLGFLRR